MNKNEPLYVLSLTILMLWVMSPKNLLDYLYIVGICIGGFYIGKYLAKQFGYE